jgi:hypothetical protein
MKKNAYDDENNGAKGSAIRMFNNFRLLGVTLAMLAASMMILAAGPLFAQVQEVRDKVPTPLRELTFDHASVDEAFDSKAAFEMLERLCEIGPRPSASDGMREQQRLLVEYFNHLDAANAFQEFECKHPLTQRPVTLSNFAVRFHPDRKKRLLFCCHYDTRPFPDQDRKNPQGRFIGANDGASGVAFLCELARHVQMLDGKYGFDFVFFDGEELVYEARRDPMFLGSTYFAETYAKGKWDRKYDYAILVDMIGDRDLQIYYEGNSLEMAPRLTKSIWSVAAQMKAKPFIAEVKHKIRDDHLPLNTIAKIATCDIIDFDYPNPTLGNAYWHTEADIPENCSAESLQVVGDVLKQWLKELQKIQ